MRFNSCRIFLPIMIFLAACAETGSRDNPLLGEWNTPFGVPPFDQIREDHYLPAFRAAMAEQKAETDAIINDPEPATFANTIEGLERSGKMLTRVSNVFFAINSAHSNDAVREVARTVAPELAAHGDDITLNRDLYARVKAVYGQRDDLDLNTEQQKLLEETHKTFVRSGVNLDDEAQARLREINSELAELSQRFAQNLLQETNDFELYVTDREDLGNLPASLVAAAAQEAERRDHESGWSFTLQRPSINPFLQYSPNREQRRQLFIGYAMRGDRGNEVDNKGHPGPDGGSAGRAGRADGLRNPCALCAVRQHGGEPRSGFRAAGPDLGAGAAHVQGRAGRAARDDA